MASLAHQVQPPVGDREETALANTLPHHLQRSRKLVALKSENAINSHQTTSQIILLDTEITRSGLIKRITAINSTKLILLGRLLRVYQEPLTLSPLKLQTSHNSILDMPTGFVGPIQETILCSRMTPPSRLWRMVHSSNLNQWTSQATCWDTPTIDLDLVKMINQISSRMIQLSALMWCHADRPKLLFKSKK